MGVGGCMGGYGTGEGGAAENIPGTQRDNLLIHGRLRQCAMCSDVHTCARV